MNICACIAKKTPEECIKVIKNLDTELIEHRMDFMDEIKGLEEIYNVSKVPVIATNRSTACGGHFNESEEKRIEHLLTAIDTGCTMIDIEIETDDELKRDVIDHAKKNNCGVIISMHDFKGTPQREELDRIMYMEKEQGADIGKIVTTAHCLEDCRVILDLLSGAKKENFPLIAFTMGELGIFTRIIAPLYGAPFMYASVEEPTGSGQLSLVTLRKIQKELIS